MNALPSPATFMRLCPRALRQSRTNIVRSRTARFLITAASQPPLRCPRNFRPIINSITQSRHASSFSVAAKKLFKEQPFSVSLAALIILCGAGILVYTNYIYQTFILDAFSAYPEPVAAKLRRAIFYTYTDPQPKNALKYYQQALSVAAELGMDPFSDEVLGIKIQVAALMERVEQFPKAIEVLEHVRRDCLKWIELKGGDEGLEGQRTRVLQKCVGISVKLGELYSSAWVQDTPAAEEKLVWAVTTVLKERQRREEEGVKEGEGDWLTNEEIGAALESLGTHYESLSHHYLATPLYLQAIALSPPTSCHTVVLMNNLSVSLAQQSPPAALGPNSPPTSRAELVQNARMWAEKAIKLAAEIGPPQRTEECDQGCAVATINLGEFLEMEGLVAESRRRYDEGRGLSRAMGFQNGVTMAETGLKRLHNREM